MDSNFTDIVVRDEENGVLLITIDRPEARNALRNHTLQEIVKVLQSAITDTNVRAVVITGGVKYFAAGADLREMSQLGPIEALTDVRPEYWRAISNFPKPLLAAVNGYALGAGCELVMHADIVIAGEGAKFGQPEINLGIIPGAGGTQRLIRTVGKPLAMKMVLSGEMIDAQTAASAGLIAEFVPDEQTLAHTLSLAKVIAAKSPLAARLAKEAMLRSYEVGLETGLNLERKSFSLLAASTDRQEGIAAFLEKRPPNFIGK